MPDEDPERTDDSVWDRLARLPSLDEEPLDEVWLPGAPTPEPDTPARPNLDGPTTLARDGHPPAPADPAPAGPAHDGRHIRVTGRANAGTAPQPTAAARAPITPPTPEHDDGFVHPDELEPLPRRRRDRPRRRIGRVVLVLGLLGTVVVAGFAMTAWVMWQQVETIDTDGSLAGGAGFTNYLIVGTDSRDGLSAELETADSLGLRVPGERSDTMVVLHVGGDGNHMVSLPRDLWVTFASGGQGKLNAARQRGGVPELIRTVATDPGVPIHHYLEVDIAGFLSVIEAVGSITIDFGRPACDPKSGLDVRTSGAVALGPEQALAYVRSRTYTEFDATAAVGLTCKQLRAQGLGTGVGNADFGRTERQRAFLLAVFDRVASTRNPVTILRVLGGLTDGLRVDDTMGMFDAIDLLRDLRGLNADARALPVSDLNVGGTSALTLNSESGAVLDLLSPEPDGGG